MALVFVAVWIAANVALSRSGRAFDNAPFSFLQGIVSAAALLTTVLILAAQRHETRLAERRAQLTLQLSIVSERKIAKLIEMLEEQRRDSEHLDDRIDLEAQAMAKRTDPKSMLDAVQDAQSELSAEG